MGSLTLSKMKIILLSALFLLVVIAAQPAKPTPPNKFQVCLDDINLTVNDLSIGLRSVSYGILDAAKWFMRSGAEGIQSYESCHAVQTQDWLAWVDTHVSETVRHCAQDGLVALGELAFSVRDITKHAPQEKILQDF